MIHHRCTRCKEESEIRHKWRGGLFCSSCLSAIVGKRVKKESQKTSLLDLLSGLLWWRRGKRAPKKLEI